MDFNVLWWLTIAVGVIVTLGIGFIFGRWTDDTAFSNKLMLAGLMLLASINTIFTLFNYFPERSKWWASVAFVIWFGLSLWGVYAGVVIRIKKKSFSFVKNRRGKRPSPENRLHRYKG